MGVARPGSSGRVSLGRRHGPGDQGCKDPVFGDVVMGCLAEEDAAGVSAGVRVLATDVHKNTIPTGLTSATPRRAYWACDATPVRALAVTARVTVSA
jgi:hypothetical protein